MGGNGDVLLAAHRKMFGIETLGQVPCSEKSVKHETQVTP
jgi:hypothetical protein